jgi:hypothetical protein
MRAIPWVFAAVAFAQPKLQLTVHTGRGQVGYDVNSTMISGEKDMIVIDPQFSLSEAHKLTAEILESKKNLAPRLAGPIVRSSGSLPMGITSRGPKRSPWRNSRPAASHWRRAFPVTGPVPGSDGAGNSFIWVPSLKAVITGDIVFDYVYFGVTRDKARSWNGIILNDRIATDFRPPNKGK